MQLEKEYLFHHNKINLILLPISQVSLLLNGVFIPSSWYYLMVELSLRFDNKYFSQNNTKISAYVAVLVLIYLIAY